MNDFFAQEEAQIKARAAALTEELQRLNERQGLLQRYRELADGTAPAVAPATVATAAPALKPAAPKAPAGDAPKKRGRPKGSKNKPKEAMTSDEGKPVDLPTLLETIGQEVNKPLTCADFVTLVRESGYKTKAKDFSNMVYQALLKLVKRGTFKKNEETRAYEFVKNAA